MKNILRTLLALIVALSCVFACASCSFIDNLLGNGGANGGGNGNGGDNGGSVTPDTPPTPNVSIDTRDDYRVSFVYSYTARIVNSNGRTEYVTAVKNVDFIYIPKTNSGFTAEALAQVEQLSYHGFAFEKWYAEWDMENQVGVGAEYAFSTTVVDKDITLYGSRGDTRADWLAGPNASYEIEVIYEDGTTAKMSDGSDEEIEEEVKKVKDVVLYIKGTGAMYDFAYPNEIDVPWHDRAGEITKIVVEEGITAIGANSFGNLTKLKSVELPETLTVIGDSAFAGCTHAGFKSLICPSSLVTIERNAFNNTGLKEVVLNEGLKTLKDSAFYRSNKIATIVIPTSLDSVGNSAFHPGAVGSKNNAHKLSKVYFLGFEKSEWDSIYVAMDNSWLVDLPTIYYYTADETIGNDTTSEIPYWHYAEVDGVMTNVPAQYCYALKYFLPSGSTLPIKKIYVPAQEKVVDGELQYTDEGILILEGVITKEIIAQQSNITYNGYRFASFSGTDPIYEGMIINDDRQYKGVRGDILSEDGGIRWELVSGVIRVYKDESAEDRIRAEVLEQYTEKLMKEELAKIDIAKVTAEIEAEIAGTSVTPEEKEAMIAARVEQKASTNVSVRLQSIQIKSSMNADIKKRLTAAFSIWDFETIVDTGALWNGSTASLVSIKGLVIEEGIEYIGKYAFNSLSSIKEVVIPASVKGIHETAFAGCSSLYSVLYRGQIKNADGTENCVGISKLSKVGVVSYNTKVYEYVETSTDKAGQFWTEYSYVSSVENEDSVYTEVITERLTWDFDGSKIVVGGSDNLPGFAIPEDAPWYGAKDRITAVEFVDNIVALGANLFNGYTNLASIKLPIKLRVIPASTFDDTGIVNNTAAYNNGVLLINGHLIKVDASKVTGSMYKTFYGVITIAGGAFEGIDISELVIASSVQYINADALPDANLERIYSENGKYSWLAVSVDANFPESVKAYFYSANNPALNASLAPTDRYFYVSGDEYIIWGCDHEYGEWQTKTPDDPATEHEILYRACINDGCTAVEEQVVHAFGDWKEKTAATDTKHAVYEHTCTVKECKEVESKEVHSFAEWEDDALSRPCNTKGCNVVEEKVAPSTEE